MGSITPTGRVHTAMREVDYDHYVTRPDGSKLPQSSAPRIIADMLIELDPCLGDRVLEIGTGSGYSTALLTELVGPNGHVTSVDIDPTLVARAAALFARHPNITVLAADGRDPTVNRPVNRVIAWTTVSHIPTAWADHATPNTIIVAPVNVTGLATTRAILRAHSTPNRDLHADRIVPGAFVDATDHAIVDWAIPSHGVDIATQDTHGKTWWFSANWLREPDQHHAGQHLLHELITNSRTSDGPLTRDERPEDFYAWLLADNPTGLTTAALGDPTWHIGYTNPYGAALITPYDGHHTTHTSTDALEWLTAWAERWRDHDRPGWAHLHPTLTRRPDGWTVRVAVH